MVEIKHITHLAIDTNILISSNWPWPSESLVSVIDGCRDLGIRIILPKLVLDEAKAEWLRQARKAIHRTKQAFEETRRRLGLTVDDAPAWLKDSPDLDAIYGEAMAKAMARLRIDLTEGTKISLSEALARSAAHEPPFAEEDESFRDSILALTFLDSSDSDSILAVLSDDGFFDDEPFRKASLNRDVAFAPFKRVRDLLPVLEEMQKAAARTRDIDRWSKVNESVSNALTTEAKIQDFKDYVSVYVMLTAPEEIVGVGGTVKEIKRVDVVGPISSHVRFSGQEKSRYFGMAISPATLTAVVQPFLDLSKGASLRDLADAFGEPREMNLAGQVEVEFSVSSSAESVGAVDLQFGSVSFVSEKDAQLRAEALRAALRKNKDL